MKMGDPHVVPLSRQAVAIFAGVTPTDGERSVSAALRRLGYTGEDQTGHGFRSMTSTLLNEQGFPPDVIELQYGVDFEEAQELWAHSGLLEVPARTTDEARWPVGKIEEKQ
jgi:hypothetical protein